MNFTLRAENSSHKAPLKEMVAQAQKIVDELSQISPTPKQFLLYKATITAGKVEVTGHCDTAYVQELVGSLHVLSESINLLSFTLTLDPFDE